MPLVLPRTQVQFSNAEAGQHWPASLLSSPDTAGQQGTVFEGVHRDEGGHSQCLEIDEAAELRGYDTSQAVAGQEAAVHEEQGRRKWLTSLYVSLLQGCALQETSNIKNRPILRLATVPPPQAGLPGFLTGTEARL